MKVKYSRYATDGDVSAIECSLINGNIEIYGCADGNVCVEKTKHTHVKIYVKGGIVKIRQIRKSLLRKTTVKIFVPAHCVPDISVSLAQGGLKIEHGIYGDLSIKANNAEAAVTDACFSNAEASCKALALDCKDVTVKQLFAVNADEGHAIIERCLCTKLDICFKNGDSGVTGLKCRDSSFTSESGSVNVNLVGAKSDYVLNLLSKNGTCNCENTETGDYNCKVYTDSGKIVIDFTDSDALAPVAEQPDEICAALGA